MHTLSELHRYAVHGIDADVGRIADIYYDDRRWIARYLVVDSRHWLRGRRVLISPGAVSAVDDGHHRLEVALTRQRVEHSPSADTAKPVSHQHRVDMYSYFGFPYDWTGRAMRADSLAGVGDGDPHLRSARAVAGYRVRATGGDEGRVDDVLVEDGSWAIRYVVVRCGHGPGSRHVLVSPGWILGVSWTGRCVDVDLTREALDGAPAYDPSRPLDRAYETRLFAHVHRLPYWRGGP